MTGALLSTVSAGLRSLPEATSSRNPLRSTFLMVTPARAKISIWIAQHSERAVARNRGQRGGVPVRNVGRYVPSSITGALLSTVSVEDSSLPWEISAKSLSAIITSFFVRLYRNRMMAEPSSTSARLQRRALIGGSWI